MAVGLVYAEMQAAAQAAADAVEPLQETSRELGATIETEAGKGFKGQAAAGFGEAVNEWFTIAVTLGPILEGYSQSLMYVAQEHATNDVEQATRAGQLADRLGGGPR
ncbi:WXG100 family type VII secretion target [Nocardioides sp. S-58]|uniref:WXG100 family type VII secretion target n=1 Tax=Nocardioides renjunii TaxID=3095075 RepID=A0ABU5K9D7_9ACTN|nr:WXG100 family type VII secretion target [Nocardioides sp. S-58]MDZ5661060.1 WXG100 family type VII secretion target [Nocardioides sp. S-58]